MANKTQLQIHNDAELAAYESAKDRLIELLESMQQQTKKGYPAEALMTHQYVAELMVLYHTIRFVKTIKP